MQSMQMKLLKASSSVFGIPVSPRVVFAHLDDSNHSYATCSRPPVLKIDNPQLNYVKKVNHEKKSSAFQEHMAIQFEVKKEFPNTGPVTSCGKIRVFSL